jgi:poly(hydroxyalkanoate) granule-associated protein
MGLNPTESNMVKKVIKNTKSVKSSKPAAAGQQFLNAGMAAFQRAQAEGTKVFEKVVKEGLAAQRKTQALAEERITEATSRVSAMANDVQSKAVGQWDKLESIFEDRVAKALNKLGVPSAKDINALVKRIDDLNKSVQKMGAKPAAKSSLRPSAASVKTTVSKTATKAVKAVKKVAKKAVK